MRLARLTAAATVIAAACIAPAAASAQAPAGDWTFIRKDAFRHYACKDKAEKGRWNVKTATYFNGKDDAVEMGIGAYAAIARGSNKNLVTSRDSAAWKGGYIRFTLRGVAESRPPVDAGLLLRPVRAMVGRLHGPPPGSLRLSTAAAR